MRRTPARSLYALLLGVLSASLAGAAPAPPEVHAPAGILVDAATGQVLWSRAPDAQRSVASTTKIMTVLLALEHGDLDSKVTVSPTAAKVPEASLNLKPRETITLNDLLYGIMLRSANDACVAAAEHISGNVPAFVERMNQRAAELGCTNTRFVNPNGLHHPDHYSTPRDLALIARAALAHPRFREIARARVYTMERSKNRYDRSLKSRFYSFLKGYPGADGVKTGYTRQAGHCFVGSATRGEFRLVAVLLHSPNIRAETATLLDWGFKYHRGGIAVRPDREIGRAAVLGGSRKTVPVAASVAVPVTVRKDAPPVRPDLSGLRLRAPVRAGQVVGTVPLKSGNETVGTAEVVSMESAGLSPLRIAGRALAGGSAFLLVGLMFGTFTKDTRRRRRRIPPRRRKPDPRRQSSRERRSGLDRTECRPIR